MNLALLNRPVTIIRQTAGDVTDDYGNPIPGVEEVATVGELQQRKRDEQADHDASVTDWLLVLPAGTVVDTDDAVLVDGRRYEVVGDPWNVRNPRTGRESHVEATVRRAAGAGDP